LNEIIHVNTFESGYDIHLKRGLINKAGELISSITRSKKIAIITDNNVAPLYGLTLKRCLEGAGFSAPIYAFTAGEKSKNHATLLNIYSFLADADITRSDIIVALGGGVVGDVAGFAAATFARGVDFVQIPTTLLAQVDSSIGGKTAVDLKEGKNLVGAFWQPRLVICDPNTLSTLDATNFSCGMAEVIKHACIRSSALFDTLLSCDETDSIIEAIITANLNIKREVVEHDEQEKGERMLLNFGHTLGHAIEKLSDFKTFTHGQAVAMGMSLITQASEKNSLTAPGTFEKIFILRNKFGLTAECGFSLSEILAAASNDKKRAGSNINLVLLKNIGESFIHTLPIERLPNFFGI
jgi:3-dehydroquinate synthase